MMHRVLSYPVEVEMAGWRSNTHTLQQCGWSISAEQSVDQSSMRLAMKHELLQMRAVSAVVSWDYYTLSNGYPRGVVFPIIRFDHFGRTIMVETRTDFTRFTPIDAQPVMVDRQVKDIDNLVHFAPALTRTKQLILPEATIPDLLDRITELQAPIRTEYFKELETERRKFHCQIVSLAA